MSVYEYAKTVRSELLAELHDAGIADAHLAFNDTTAWVTTDAEQVLVDPVVAAHDPSVYEQAEEVARHTYEDAIAYLKTIRTTPNASITIDQAKNAIKALIDIAKVQHQQLRDQ